MVDNYIRHQVNILPQFFDICPASQAGINLGVIDGIKAGIRPVTGVIEGQDMNTTEKPGQRPLQQSMQRSYIASSQAIGIRDELNIVFHAIDLCSNGWAANTGNPTINPS